MKMGFLRALQCHPPTPFISNPSNRFSVLSSSPFGSVSLQHPPPARVFPFRIVTLGVFPHLSCIARRHSYVCKIIICKHPLLAFLSLRITTSSQRNKRKAKRTSKHSLQPLFSRFCALALDHLPHGTASQPTSRAWRLNLPPLTHEIFATTRVEELVGLPRLLDCSLQWRLHGPPSILLSKRGKTALTLRRRLLRMQAPHPPKRTVLFPTLLSEMTSFSENLSLLCACPWLNCTRNAITLGYRWGGILSTAACG